MNLGPHTHVHDVTITNYSTTVVNCNPMPTARGTLGHTNVDVSSVRAVRLGRTFTTRNLSILGTLGLASGRSVIGVGNNTVTLKRPLNYSNTHVAIALLGTVRRSSARVNLTAVYVNLNRNVTAVVRHIWISTGLVFISWCTLVSYGVDTSGLVLRTLFLIWIVMVGNEMWVTRRGSSSGEHLSLRIFGLGVHCVFLPFLNFDVNTVLFCGVVE